MYDLIACQRCLRNVYKVHRDCFQERHRVLVTTVCSETFIIGALQKCLFYCSSGRCIWDLCISLAPCTITHAQPHNSCFLVPFSLPPHPGKVQCIGARLYRQWCVISESEYTKAVIGLVKSHHHINVKLQSRFCLNSLLVNYGENGSN
jgi:hypothetical protein